LATCIHETGNVREQDDEDLYGDLSAAADVQRVSPEAKDVPKEEIAEQLNPAVDGTTETEDARALPGAAIKTEQDVPEDISTHEAFNRVATVVGKQSSSPRDVVLTVSSLVSQAHAHRGRATEQHQQQILLKIQVGPLGQLPEAVLIAAWIHAASSQSYSNHLGKSADC
jgi:hypothetical protein